MVGLVDHMNSVERHFWSQGDEDGIIVHDKKDIPLLHIMYTNNRMTFKIFEETDDYAELNKTEIGYALLNVIGYMQQEGFDFGPSILGSEAHVVGINAGSNGEDWAL